MSLVDFNRLCHVFFSPIIFFILTVFVVPASAGGEQAKFSISISSISAPQGLFFLIKTEDSTCAARFVEWKQSNPGASYLHERLEGGAVVHVYSMSNKVGTDKKWGELEIQKLGRKYWHLVGRLMFVFGNTELTCGDKKFQWYVPGVVQFNESQEGVNARIRFCPTPWTRIEDVVVEDRSLRCFSYDLQRKEPIEISFEKGSAR